MFDRTERLEAAPGDLSFPPLSIPVPEGFLRLGRHLGFRSFTAYVEERLNISAGRAWFLARLDRSLTGLEATKAAIRQGKIGSVAARFPRPCKR